MPQAKVIALLVHGANPGNPVFVGSVKNAASSLSLHSQAFEVGTVGELEDTFTRIARTKADALMVIDDPTFATHAQEIAALALNHRIPTMFGSHHFVRAGGLMAYGVVYEDLFRRAAIFVDRILRGANPADMPIEQPTKFELVINLKTAKALGLTIPPSVLGRADQVIE
jgi:putative ABC transport system substrate-binding protein